MLGMILSGLRDESEAMTALLDVGDIALVASVEAACARGGDSVGEYTSAAVRRFANAASDDDWLSLMTALNSAENPARAGLESMLRWALAHESRDDGGYSDGCSCGGACHA